MKTCALKVRLIGWCPSCGSPVDVAPTGGNIRGIPIVCHSCGQQSQGVVR